MSIILVWYGIICIVVSIVVSQHKHATFFEIFLISIFATPLIAAILALSYPIKTEDSIAKKKKRLEEEKRILKEHSKRGRSK